MGKIQIRHNVEKEKRKKYRRVKQEVNIGGWSEHFPMGVVFEEGEKDISGRNLSKYEDEVLLLKAPGYNYPLYCDADCFEEVTDE